MSAYVQSAVNHPPANAGSGASIAVTFGSAVAAGSLLVLFVTNLTDTAPTAVGDSVNGANAWTLAGSWQTVFLKSAIYYFANSAAGTPTVTVTWGAARDNRSINVAEYSGIATSSPKDQSAANGITSNSTTPTSTNTGVPTENGELFFAGMLCDSDTTTITAGTSLSYTKRRSTSDTFAYSSAIEDAVQATAGAIDANWTTSNNGRYVCNVATFKQAAAGYVAPIIWNVA